MNTPSSRHALTVTASLSLALALTSCSALSASSSDSESPGGSGDNQNKVTIATSFYPIQYLAESIGGDHVSVTSVTPPNVEPHDYELSPKDVTDLSSNQVIAYVSDFQPSLDDALKQVSGPEVVDLAASINLVHHDGVEEGHEGDADGGATDKADEGTHEHESEKTDEAHHHGADALDPHFWLDPVRMKDAATALEESLAKADPDHASDYKANLDTLIASLGEIDKSYSEGLNACERKTFVTSHSAFGYIADRYHLTQASISGIDPESEPSPAELAAVKDVIRTTGTTTIFTEELVSPKTAEALAKETGAKTAVLTPIESKPESTDYAGAMTANLQELRTALSCK